VLFLQEREAATYLSGTGKKEEDVPLRLLQCPADRSCRGCNRVALRSPKVADLHRVHSPLAVNNLRLGEQILHGGQIECRGHDKNAQLRTEAPLNIQTEGKRGIGMQTSLVELVEYHQADPFEERVVLQPPGEQSLCDDFKPGAAGDLPIEANGITDGSTDLFTDG